MHTARRYRRAELEALLRAHGFGAPRVRYWNALLLPAAFAVRKLRRSQPAHPTSDLAPLPRVLNEALSRALAAERWLGTRVDLPFGTSLLGIATKA